MSGLNRDGRENSANNNELDAYHNKKDSEKKRREQENFYIEELAMLISAQIPEYSDSDDSSGPYDSSKLEKGSILQETVDKLKKLNQARLKDIQREEVSSSRSFLPKEILGSLVLEALDGFMFITSNEGNIDFVSDNVFDYLGFRQEDLLAQKVIFNFIHHGDHARFRVNLEPDTWKTWKKLPPNSGGRQGFDRSKVFNLRFRINNEPKVESLEERQQRLDQYENMQVSAIVMSNPLDNTGVAEDPKSGLFCIARRISRNERSGLTPVEQFTTRCHRQTLEIETVDSEGLPQLYKNNISSHLHGKTLVEIVHPQDIPLIKEHIEGFYKNVTDTSRVYRMVLPPPMNIIHVKTKTKDFRPQPGNSHPGFVMSTHSIIRENELQIEDLPAMRPELHGMVPDNPEMIQMSSGSSSDPSSSLPMLLLECSKPSPLVQTLQSPNTQTQATSVSPRIVGGHVSRAGSSISSPRVYSDNNRSEMLEKLLSPPPPSPVPIPSPGSIRGRITPHSSNGGNELLKELLRPKENEVKSDGLCFKSRQEETITIGQILNEKREENKERVETSELLKQLRKPPESVGRITNSELAQLLQKSPRNLIHSDLKRSSTSGDEGPVSKQVPSLEKMLAGPVDRTIPPPLPRKWSEIPQEKLPRDIVIDKIKDAPIRNNNSQTVSRGSNVRSPGSRSTLSPSTAAAAQSTSSRTIIRNASKSNVVTSSVAVKSSAGTNLGDNNPLIPSGFGDYGDAASEFNDLLTDPVFSKILDGVDLGDDNIDQMCDQNLAKQKIHEIEQSLKLAEHSFVPTSVPAASPGMSVMTSLGQQCVLTSSGSVVTIVTQPHQFPVIQTGAGQAGQPQHRILQPRNAGPSATVSFQNLTPLPPAQPPGPRSPSLQGTNMEELLKGIPPNVSIPTNSDQQPGGPAARINSLERQMSSPSMSAPGPGPSRHLSGDTSSGYSRPQPGRHLSGDQLQHVLAPGGRRVSGDTSLARFTLPGPGPGPGPGNVVSVGGGSGHDQLQYSLDPGSGHQTIIRTSSGSGAGGSQIVRQGRVTLGNTRRAPGGRALSQEDLESFGLSVEVSQDFSPQPQTGPSPSSGQFSLVSTGPGPPQQSPRQQQGPPQFVSVSLPDTPQQFISLPQQPHPLTSPAPATSQRNNINSPFNAQFSQAPAPNTINSKQPFQF